MEDEKEQLWIGITKCDKWRQGREEDIQRVTKNAHFELEKYDKAAIVALHPLDYWREALSCYQNGAYMAAALMCRCTTELVVYLAVTRRENKPKKFSGGIVKVDFAFVEERWGKVLEAAKKQEIVKGRLEEKINKIREQGNYVAHYGSKVDESYLNYNVTRKIKGGWIGKKEALDLIERTTQIINQVLKNQAESSD